MSFSVQIREIRGKKLLTQPPFFVAVGLRSTDSPRTEMASRYE
ncbi:MAG: hypothetical protein QNK37_02100 [Acidobacteriota bacterium]|nr:hypothetical protein [Acidobacteriota bacterium]